MTGDDTPTIRRARPADVDDVVRMARQLSRHPVETGAVRAEVEAAVAGPASVLLVAEDPSGGAAPASGPTPSGADDGGAEQVRVVGYLLAVVAPMPVYGGVAFVQELFVEEDRRRRGVGRALVGAVHEVARERGVGRVALATRRAADFYESLGYSATGARWFTVEVAPA